MFHENEVIVMLLGLGVLIALAAGRFRIKQFPAWRLFLASFVISVVAWACTVLEDLALPRTLNVIEHICYATSTGLLALWAYVASSRKAGRRP
jgi:hypothetical protein